MSSFPFPLSQAEHKSKGTICHCSEDTHARIGLWAMIFDRRTEKRKIPAKTMNALGKATALPLRCEVIKIPPMIRDIQTNTTRNLRSALIIRKGMNPGANSFGLRFKWKRGGRIKQKPKVRKKRTVCILFTKNTPPLGSNILGLFIQWLSTRMETEIGNLEFWRKQESTADKGKWIFWRKLTETALRVIKNLNFFLEENNVEPILC